MPPREQIFLRISPELKAAILNRAQDEGKNLTEWTVQVLESAVGLERPQSDIERRLDSLMARIEILEQAQDKQNYRSESDEGKQDSKTASGQAGKTASKPNLKALTTGGRADWKGFVRDNPGLTIDELTAIACEVYPERQQKTMKQNISRAM